MSQSNWPLWEVFVRSQHGLAHKHVGSLHAPDAEMAINNARDVYTRRNEGVSIWVVRAADIVASSPSDKEPLFDPSSSKVYRHPTFFPMPEEIKMLGDDMDQALFQYLLRMGDTTLVLSQRLCEWTGHGPVLEEEMAVANTALDLLGQARMWLTLAGEVEGQGRDEDALAYLRDAPEYRNYLLVERPNGHYGDTVARQFVFDIWHLLLLDRLQSSSDERVAAIAAKSIKEVAYHARRSSDLLIRLGDGTPLSLQRMQEAVEDVWRHVGVLFVDDEITRELASRGV